MNKFLTLILAGLTMVGPLAIDTYLPSLPAIGLAFGVSAILVQQTLSVYLFTFAFMMLLYGTLSDSFGRRPVILIALVIYIVASFGAAFAPSFGWLLVCRALQGFAAGAGSVVSQAIVRDRVSGAEAQRILSHIMMVFGLAPALAPILGGWLQVSLGWRSIFVFLGAFGVLMLVVSYRSLQESLPIHSRHPFHFGLIARNYWNALKHPQFLTLALAVGMAFGGLALYIGSAANFVMHILHLPETAFAWLFVPLVGGMMIGSAVGARYATRLAPAKMMIAGYGVMAIAALLNVGYNMLFVAAIPGAVLPLMLYTFGLSLAIPAITLSALDLFPDNRGLAASLQSFVQMLVFAVVSGIVAPVLFESALKLAFGVLTGLVISFVCWRLGQSASSGNVNAGLVNVTHPNKS